MTKITIYSDGACKGNPGRGGWAAILQAEDGREVTVSGAVDRTTNNRMELMAVIRGLERISRSCACNVTIVTDSTYIAGGIAKGGHGSNADLWDRYDTAARHVVTATIVKGHGEDRTNDRCDLMASNAATSGQYAQDEGYDG